jgi:hypothetical protein
VLPRRHRSHHGKSAEGLHGLSDAYWRRFHARWYQAAFTCVYAHQDVFRLLGRDPVEDPLTPIEQGVFTRMVEAIVQRELRQMMPSSDARAIDEDDELAPVPETEEHYRLTVDEDEVA